MEFMVWSAGLTVRVTVMAVPAALYHKNKTAVVAGWKMADILRRVVMVTGGPGWGLDKTAIRRYLFPSLSKGRRCAVHFSIESMIKEMFPDTEFVSDQAVVWDEPFITCPGGLAALALAADLVAGHCGAARVAKSWYYLMAGQNAWTCDTTSHLGEDLAQHCPDPRVIRWFWEK